VTLDTAERLAYVALGTGGVSIVDLDGPTAVIPIDLDHNGAARFTLQPEMLERRWILALLPNEVEIAKAGILSGLQGCWPAVVPLQIDKTPSHVVRQKRITRVKSAKIADARAGDSAKLLID